MARLPFGAQVPFFLGHLHHGPHSSAVDSSDQMWRKPYIPTAEEIQRTARAVIQVLVEHDFMCCLIGSTAAAIYGAENRNPRDVDIVILSTTATNNTSVEEIKHLITENNSSDFYLLPSKDPTASHKILYYILTPQYPDPTSQLHRACKVDLLLPGTIGIPHIPPEQVHYEEYFPDIPLVPFLVLLLLKVRAWSEHRIDRRIRWGSEKVRFDEADVRELLDLAVNEYLVRVKKVEAWAGEVWMEEMRGYVKEFVEKFPKTRGMWEEMGFVVRSEWSLPPE